MILLIDNYDSFVFNIEQYIKDVSNEEVTIVRNDKITLSEIINMNPNRIILSPGPKHPKDSNICLEILKNIKNIPILGICLGHQALGLVFDSTISQLSIPIHGKTSKITVTSKCELFKNIPKQFNVMRYHSLYIDTRNISDDLEIIAKTNDNIIMAIKHKYLPLYGLQFHPESYFSEYGKDIINNFINL